MKRLWVTALTLAVGVVFMASQATAAEECSADKAGSELTGDEAEALYQCLKDSLQAGYAEGEKRWIPEEFVTDYPQWTRASTIPAAPGFHGGRFLITYVNDAGDEEYLKYGGDDMDIPAGTVIAKESFSVNDSGEVSKGPLFIMQKVEEGTSPETMDWYYMMVAPNGAPQAVNVYDRLQRVPRRQLRFPGRPRLPRAGSARRQLDAKR